MRPRESFVGQPIRSLQTMLRVIAEYDGSIPTVVPDGIYGNSTMTSVSTFQRHHEIPMTGVTDQQTWEAVVAAYEEAMVFVGKAQPIEIIMNPGKVYRMGDGSPNVMLMQCMLMYLSQKHTSIPEPAIGGFLDAQTAQSLAAFQVLSGLSDTGELDKMTWKHLVNAFTLNTNMEGNL